MLSFHVLQMDLERLHQVFWEDRDSVLVALAPADDQLMSSEVQILHAQAQGFQPLCGSRWLQPYSTPIQQATHQSGWPLQLLQHRAHLHHTQHNR